MDLLSESQDHLFSFLICISLAAVRGMRDFRSLTRDWTHTPGGGSLAPEPLDHQRSPNNMHFCSPLRLYNSGKDSSPITGSLPLVYPGNSSSPTPPPTYLPVFQLLLCLSVRAVFTASLTWPSPVMSAFAGVFHIISKPTESSYDHPHYLSPGVLWLPPTGLSLQAFSLITWRSYLPSGALSP